jgi:folate-binding Fe-S cluster repair protein YgfZ
MQGEEHDHNARKRLTIYILSRKKMATKIRVVQIAMNGDFAQYLDDKGRVWEQFIVWEDQLHTKYHYDWRQSDMPDEPE